MDMNRRGFLGGSIGGILAGPSMMKKASLALQAKMEAKHASTKAARYSYLEDPLGEPIEDSNPFARRIDHKQKVVDWIKANGHPNPERLLIDARFAVSRGTAHTPEPVHKGAPPWFIRKLHIEAEYKYLLREALAEQERELNQYKLMSLVPKFIQGIL